jgi:hypothetical protein
MLLQLLVFPLELLTRLLRETLLYQPKISSETDNELNK